MVAVQEQRLDRSVAPSSEPVSVAEAKKHLEILSTDTTHDDAITAFVAAAREQLENDTGYGLLTQTFTLSRECFPSNNDPIYLQIRPIQSITSITYYDSSNAQQTLSTDVYGLDVPRRLAYLKYDQEWPSITQQHNGIVVTIVAGYGSAAAVPYLFKQAILLQVGKWFMHRDMTEPERMAHDRAYERIVRRIMTPHFP